MALAELRDRRDELAREPTLAARVARLTEPLAQHADDFALDNDPETLEALSAAQRRDVLRRAVIALRRRPWLPPALHVPSESPEVRAALAPQTAAVLARLGVTTP